jgi:hypothetical protein
MDRYMEKVDKNCGSDDCHPWTGSLDGCGYGFFRVDRRMVRAHRWAYGMMIEPLTPGEVVRHTCDNPPCQNPRHWIKGSVKDNVHDMIRRGRSPDRSGGRNGRAKLLDQNVLEIRASVLDPKQLAIRYDVTVTNIHAIQKRLTWKHLP